MAERIAISKIRTDGGTQPRKGLDDVTVAQYTESVKAKAKFPPVVVYYDGAAYWLADGFHRVQAHRNAQKRAILADIRQGNLREAILHSAGANATHGLRRSNDDKRRAVMCLLDDPEWSQWSDRAIAKRCKVSHVFVGKLRPDSGNVTSMERKFTHPKTGEVTTMKMTKAHLEAMPILDKIIRDYFFTSDYASLASHARYLSKITDNPEDRKKWLVWSHINEFLAANGLNLAWSSVVNIASDLAHEYASKQPPPPKTKDDEEMAPMMSSAFMLLTHIYELKPEDRTILRETCKQQQENGLPAARTFWNRLQELMR